MARGFHSSTPSSWCRSQLQLSRGWDRGKGAAMSHGPNQVAESGFGGLWVGEDGGLGPCGQGTPYTLHLSLLTAARHGSSPCWEWGKGAPMLHGPCPDCWVGSWGRAKLGLHSKGALFSHLPQLLDSCSMGLSDSLP